MKYSWKCGAVADLLLLQIDRELLHLAEQKAGERRARVGDARQVGEEAAERERARSATAAARR